MARKNKKTESIVNASASQEPVDQQQKETIKVGVFVLLFLIYLMTFLQVELPWSGQLPADAPPMNRLSVMMVSALQFPAYWTGGGHYELGLLDRVPVLLVASLICVVAYLVGRLVLDLLQVDQILTRLEVIVFSLGTGLGLLSLWTLIIGLAGLLQYPMAVMVPVTIVLIIAGKRWRSKWFDETESESKESSPASFPYAWLIAASPILFCIVWGGLMPPYEYDVIEYHLQVPKEWYQAGQIEFLPHNVYAQMPMGAEMFALLAMIFIPGEDCWFAGALVGKTVIALFAPLTALAVYCAAKRWISQQAAIVAAVVLISTPWITKVAVTGLVDGVWAFYGFLALYAVLIWWFAASGNSEKSHESQPAINGHIASKLLFLAGLLAGFAVACKYPALPLCVIPLAVWIAVGRKKFDWQPVLIFGCGVLIACGLWFGKNWVQTGNPTYPLLGTTFGGESRTAEKIAQWDSAHAVPTDNSDNAIFDAVKNIGWKSPWTCVLLTPLIVLSLFTKHRKLVGLLLGFSAFYLLVWWTATHRYDRFLIPLVPIGALLSGVGASWLSGRIGQLCTNALLGLSLLIGFLMINSLYAIKIDDRIFVSLSELRKSQEQSRGAIKFLNNHVDVNQTVLMTGDSAPFYLKPNYLYHTCFDDSPLLPLIGKTAEERQQYLREHHIDYVYVNWSEINRFRSPGNYGFPDEVTPKLIEELQSQGILGPPVYPEELGLNPSSLVFPVLPIQD
ncbi:MAG: hypothetical protein COA78_30210 [Blastopirellula sp.]|nr:MAG: hypothetical protein COA78_30210 [Blastopirellula sp.]